MHTLLLVGGSAEHVQKLQQILNKNYTLLSVPDSQSAISLMCTDAHEISLVIADVDVSAESSVHLLKWFTEHSHRDLIPVVLAANSVSVEEMESYYSLGALDYITYDMPPLLLEHRLCTFCQLNGYLKENHYHPAVKLHGENDFLFHNCIDAALFLEYNSRENQIFALMINDRFFGTVGRDRSFFEQHRENLVETVLPEDFQSMMLSMKDALEKGTANCLFHNNDTKQIFQVNYRHIASGKRGDILFVLVQDVTENLRNQMTSQALLQLPGTLICDYDVLNDYLVITSNMQDGLHTIKAENFMRQKRPSRWLSPQSRKSFMAALRRALQQPSSGSLEFLGYFGGRFTYRWHRVFYRSIADGRGTVFRLVARIDDIDKNAWPGLNPEADSIYDSATQLLTYQALQEFIRQKLRGNSCGVLFLLDLEGQEELCQAMGDWQANHLMRRIAQTLASSTSQEDMIGRFGSEGFVLFWPAPFDAVTASRKAEIILHNVESMFDASIASLIPQTSLSQPQRQTPLCVQCRIGIAIADGTQPSVTELLHHASIALWHLKNRPGEKYAIYRPGMD